MNKPVFHNVVQGTDEWHALRAKHFTASEASPMLGRSPHKTRQQLLREKATAGESEIFQPIADSGHAAEAGALAMAENLVSEQLYPATVSRVIDGLPLLASCDGLTMNGEIAWEHKLWNEADAAEVRAGSVPEKHRAQCEQVALVTGAQRVLFMISDGTEDNVAICMYQPEPDLAQEIITGWKQFAEDLASYQHVETPLEAIASVPESLPTLLLEITGAVRDTNLATYQQVVTERIRSINTDLQTDQDFAYAEQIVKFLGNAEKEVDAAKSRALARTQSVDELFRAVDALKAEMRAKRLELEKLVRARKETIRANIVNEALDAVSAHAAKVGKSLPGSIPGFAPPPQARGDIIAAMKGKKTITSLRDAAAQVVTDTKLAMNAQADGIRANIATFDELATKHDAAHLFPDLASMLGKESDDFAAGVKARISEHTERERQRAEAERDRIRQEDAARVQAEAKAVKDTDANDAEHHAGSMPSKPAPPPSDERPSLPLGELCERLGFTVRADFIESLGFAATREKRAMLYRESDWPHICDAIVVHVRKVRDHAVSDAA